jgi:hypothetical protein
MLTPRRILRLALVCAACAAWPWLPISVARCQATADAPPESAAELSAASPFDCADTIAEIDQLWRVPIGFDTVTERGRRLQLGGLARVYYLNDQRYEFTGNEATFGVEAQFYGHVCEPIACGTVNLVGELYLQEPFDRNILVDNAVRQSFAHNFDIEPLEISQLTIGWTAGDWTMTWGRFVTPFGRYHFPIFSNSRTDTAFIRSEAVHFRENGLLLEWSPGMHRLAAALTNGSKGLDTNSSKAVVARYGIESEPFVGGISVKWQDGVGSESQKEYVNHVGLDWLLRNRCWGITGEVIYDEYGLRRPGFDLDDITWGRSLYNRQLNAGFEIPIRGVGYYAGLIRYDGRRTWTASYGQFFPESIGDPVQDQTVDRIMGQLQWSWGEHASTYLSTYWETGAEGAFGGRDRKSLYLLAGWQYAL